METTAIVQTEKASRYMKAMINHFGSKVNAAYEGDKGHVDFGFGRCEMEADETALTLRALGKDAGEISGVKNIIGSHLVRFAKKEDLSITWN